MCQTLEDEKKCYKTFGKGGIDASLVCLDEENSTSIESYCVHDPDKQSHFTSELCPENAITKTAYHQCYTTSYLKHEK